MPSVTGGQRSDAIHMCKCGSHTLYHCRLLGSNEPTCLFKEKRKKEFKAILLTAINPNDEQLDTAYSEGHDAYHDGHALSTNPYSQRSEQANKWRTGWKDERSDDPYWEKIKRYHK